MLLWYEIKAIGSESHGILHSTGVTRLAPFVPRYGPRLSLTFHPHPVPSSLNRNEMRERNVERQEPEKMKDAATSKILIIQKPKGAKETGQR